MEVIETLKIQLAQDHEALRARGLMIEILQESVERLTRAGFKPWLDLGPCDALVTLHLDSSAWALKPVAQPTRVLDREPGPGAVPGVFGLPPGSGWPAAAPCPVVSVSDLNLNSLLASVDPKTSITSVTVPKIEVPETPVPAALGPGMAEPKLSGAAVPSTWTPERDAELLRLRAEGLDRLAISDRMAMSVRSVENRLARLRKAGRDVPAPAPRSTFWTEDRVAEAIKLLRSGLTGAEAAERLGVSRQVFYDKMRLLRSKGVDVPELDRSAGILRAQESRRLWDEGTIARLIALYEAGKTDAEIAAGMGDGFTAVAVANRLSILRKEGRVAEVKRRAMRASVPRKDSAGAAVKPEQKSKPVSKPVKADPAKVAAAPVPRPVPVPVAKPAPVPVAVQRPVAAPVEVPPRDVKAEIIAAHLDQLPVQAGFDAELDLELCEAVFGGIGLQIFALDAGIDSEAALSRFDTIVAPFREVGSKHLPIETAGLLLPVMRARVAGARGAAA